MVLLLLVRVDVIHRVVGQLHEFSDVLDNSHGTLLQIAELIRLHLHYPLRDVVFLEGLLKFLPGDVLRVL